jgi:RNase H-like domain found in reverse transcriptase
MTPAQRRYTVTERELLSVVLTLKKFCNMLFGYPINIYTDHKNVTFSTFQADHTICWRLYVEEFGPSVHYIKGETNTGADALLQLNMVNTIEGVTEVMSEVYALDEEMTCPIAYNVLSEAQQKEFTAPQHNAWPTKKFGHFMLYVTPTNHI